MLKKIPLLSLSLTAATLFATEWPNVLVIDDFANGTDKWENRDSGVLSITAGPQQDDKALLWTSTDDSDGSLIFKDLKRPEIDFSQYDILLFDLKVSGRPIWNIGPIIQQFPLANGYRALYYSVDTLHPFDQWFTYAQDLRRWENAPPDSYDHQRQEFSFSINQLAAPGQTSIALANIRLAKNPLGLKPSYPGHWGKLSDGSQTTHFAMILENKRDTPLTVRLSLDPADAAKLKVFTTTLPDTAITLLPGEQRTVTISLTATATALATAKPWYGETANVAVRLDEVPGLALYTSLTAGYRPEKTNHPQILCSPQRMHELHKTYRDPAQRNTLGKALLQMVTDGEKALAYEPEYPAFAATGRTTDPISGGKLQQLDVPNLPFNVYQDPLSGRIHSGPIYDAGMQRWLGKHMANASTAHKLALAYLVSGRIEFAKMAAQILRTYATLYPTLPINAYEHGCPASSACSGSTRIGGTFMRERVWLTNLAVALDSIRPAGVLTEDDIYILAKQLFVPSAMNMMDHKVGIMNLQMMIQSASLYAALAIDNPGLVAQAVYSSHGALRIIDGGYLDDGNWWENPSYQNVMNMCAYPVMAVCLRSGILSPEPRFAEILTSFYRLAGPDGITPELGTGGAREAALDNTAAHVFASLIPDPRLTWIAANRKPLPHVGEMYPMAVIGAQAPLIPVDKATTPIATNTVNFPDYGGIAMRIPATDAYAYFQYGRELTPGHLNKLSLHAYGKGGWYLRNVMGGYNDNFHDFLETVASATTIMIDGRNTLRDTGTLLYQQSADGIEIAVARENAAWPDGEHTRAVILTTGPLIIIDRCRATDSQEHTFEWLYHSARTNLELDPEVKLAKAPERLGDAAIYTSLKVTGKFAKTGDVHWIRKNGSGMRMALLPRGELFHTMITDAIRPSGGLVWRQRAKTTHFAAALWPYAKDEAGAPTIEEISSKDDLYTIKVTAPEGTWQITVNFATGKVTL